MRVSLGDGLWDWKLIFVMLVLVLVMFGGVFFFRKVCLCAGIGWRSAKGGAGIW